MNDDDESVARHSAAPSDSSIPFTVSEMAARLSEPELLEFLFLPGFSTKEAVTEISGRGVGLDVVQDMARTVGEVCHYRWRRA